MQLVPSFAEIFDSNLHAFPSPSSGDFLGGELQPSCRCLVTSEPGAFNRL